MTPFDVFEHDCTETFNIYLASSGFLENDAEFTKLQAFVWKSEILPSKSRTRPENVQKSGAF